MWDVAVIEDAAAAGATLDPLRVAVGAGKRLFEPGEKVPLRLIDSTVFSTGVLHLVYGPAR